jgi:hypothetical protein
MFDDIGVYAAAVGFPAANVEAPLPFFQNTFLKDFVTQ